MFSNQLRSVLNEQAIAYARKHRLKVEARKTAVLFPEVEGMITNFNASSFNNIRKNGDWLARTQKPHSQVRGAKELQSSNSSDALLMSIFCYPRITACKGLTSLLNIAPNTRPVFGWNPEFSNEDPKYPTEVDMKIGNNIFEAKLTESDFTDKEQDIVLGYEQFGDTFETSLLKIQNGKYKNYQLTRNFLAAKKYDFHFTLLVDMRRPDLIREFLDTVKAVKDPALTSRLNFITWQEITEVVPAALKGWLKEKYGF